MPHIQPVAPESTIVPAITQDDLYLVEVLWPFRQAIDAKTANNLRRFFQREAFEIEEPTPECVLSRVLTALADKPELLVIVRSDLSFAMQAARWAAWRTTLSFGQELVLKEIKRRRYNAKKNAGPPRKRELALLKALGVQPPETHREAMWLVGSLLEQRTQ